MASKIPRLLKEYRDIVHEAALQDTHHRHDRVIVLPKNVSDMAEWTAYICGPDGTPYHNRFFQLNIQIPQSYPLDAPKIKFATPIFHPNIHFKTGEICLDILKTEWSPAWTLIAACRAIVAMLSNPEPDSPLNCNAGNLLRDGDQQGYNSLARMYAIDLGMLEPPVPDANA